jgi:3-hydroxyacyl-[acyl-carrier-protein] dehydratase
MRLTYIDRIVELEPGKRITAIKNLSISEEYLADHFPYFPIMPGVLMLEAMYQTAAWLTRVTDNFEHSLVTMTEANNVKYSDFVEPGQTLHVVAELIKQEDNQFRFKCQGEVNEKVAVRGRLVLQVARLAEQEPDLRPVDDFMVAELRQKFGILYPPPRTQSV